MTLVAGQQYWATVYAVGGGGNWYPATLDYWSSGPGAGGLASGVLTMPNTATSLVGQDSYSNGNIWAVPTQTDAGGTNWWVDVEVAPIQSGPAAMLPAYTAFMSSM